MADPVAGTTLLDRMIELVRAHQHGWGPALIGVSALVEYLFPPYPGEMIVLFGAFLVAKEGWSMPLWTAMVLGGSLLGVIALYGVGRLLRGRRAAPGGRLAALQVRIDELVVRFEKNADAWLVVNRFVPSIRWMFIVAAGISGHPPVRTIAAAFLSAVLWNGCVLAVGHLVGGHWEQLMAVAAWLGELGRWGAIALVVLAAAWLAVRGRGGKPGADAA